MLYIWELKNTFPYLKVISRIIRNRTFLGNSIHCYSNQNKQEDLFILEKGIVEYFLGSVEKFCNQLVLNNLESNGYEKVIENYTKLVHIILSRFTLSMELLEFIWLKENLKKLY